MKIIISGSSKLSKQVIDWKNYFQELGYQVLDHPKLIHPNKIKEELPKVYQEFYKNLEQTDIFFLMNEDKNDIVGYIGPNMYAELTYAIMQNLIHHKNIKIYLLKMPNKNVSCYDEINFYLEIGCIQLYQKDTKKINKKEITKKF